MTESDLKLLAALRFGAGWQLALDKANAAYGDALDEYAERLMYGEGHVQSPFGHAFAADLLSLQDAIEADRS